MPRFPQNQDEAMSFFEEGQKKGVLPQKGVFVKPLQAQMLAWSKSPENQALSRILNAYEKSGKDYKRHPVKSASSTGALTGALKGPPSIERGGEEAPSLIRGSHVLHLSENSLESPASSIEGLRVFRWSDFLKEKAKPSAWAQEKIKSLLKVRDRSFPLALFQEGLIVSIEQSLSRPLEMRLSPGASLLPIRLFIFLNAGAKADITEVSGKPLKKSAAQQPQKTSQKTWSEKSQTPSLLMHIQTQVFIGKGASLSHIRIDREERRHFVFNSLSCEAGEESAADFLTASFNAEKSHYETSLSQSRRSVSHIHGLSVSCEKEDAGQRFCAIHKEEEGESRQFCKAFVFDSAKHVFQGQIVIEKAAQKTKAVQLSQNTVLGPKAKAFSSPELDVRADDVEARHGASVSSLKENQEALFYLQSRGIGKQEALSLLLRGAIQKALSPFKHQAALLPVISAKLQEKIKTSAL